MSIIAVKKEKKKITIIADSQESFGDSLCKNVPGIKLRKISNNVIIGGAGNGHILSLFYAYVEKNTIDHIDQSNELVEYFKNFNLWVKDIIMPFTDDPQVISSTQFILIINNKVWEFNSFYIRELKIGEITSIGSGADQLLCCMELTSSLKKAIVALCKFNLHCSEPLDIMIVETNE